MSVIDFAQRRRDMEDRRLDPLRAANAALRAMEEMRPWIVLLPNNPEFARLHAALGELAGSLRNAERE